MTSPIQISSRMHLKARVQHCGWPDCEAACCLYGAWVDIIQAQTVLENAKLIAAWMPPEQADPEGWFDGQEEPDPHALSGKVRHTTVLANPDHYGGSACVFLRADQKCALQAAAEAEGLHKWAFKPFYCILHPLELDEQGRITMDDLESMTAEPGSCLRKGQEEISLTDLFKEEIDYLLNRNLG